MTRAAVFLLCSVMSGVAFGSSSSLWETSSFTDFLAGKMEGVALSRDGHLTLAPQLDTVFASGEPVIWSVVPDPAAAGALYVATGHRGRVYHIDSKGASALVWTSDKPEVFALAASA